MNGSTSQSKGSNNPVFAADGLAFAELAERVFKAVF
jgi:hypothetical protein